MRIGIITYVRQCVNTQLAVACKNAVLLGEVSLTSFPIISEQAQWEAGLWLAH